MKRFLLTLAAAAISLFAADAEEKTKTYDFGDIKAINAGHTYEIYVTEGNSHNVKVVLDDRLEEYMDIRYNSHDSTLKLSMEDLPLKYRTGNIPSIKVYLEMDMISSISLSGASSAVFEGGFRSDELDIDLSGASKLKNLTVDGRSLELDCSGASDACLAGDFTDEVDIDMSGAGKASYNGNSESFEGDFSGACKFSGSGEYDECSIECSGATDIIMEGSGSTIEIECSGACKADARNYKARKAELSLSGSCKAYVHADETLTYDVSRASKMIYYGDAELKDISEYNNIEKGR